jgi:hypothetical protein
MSKLKKILRFLFISSFIASVSPKYGEECFPAPFDVSDGAGCALYDLMGLNLDPEIEVRLQC